MGNKELYLMVKQLTYHYKKYLLKSHLQINYVRVFFHSLLTYTSVQCKIVNPGRMHSDTCSVTNSKSTPFILELNIKKYLACELIKKKCCRWELHLQCSRPNFYVNSREWAGRGMNSHTSVTQQTMGDRCCADDGESRRCCNLGQSG